MIAPVADDVTAKDVSYIFQERYISLAVRGEACHSEALVADWPLVKQI